MADKPQEKTNPAEALPFDIAARMKGNGMGDLMGLGTAWMEAMSDMSAELMSFVAERIKEDVKTQHKMLHCKDVAQLQHIQAEFIQKAVDQYHEETGKLVEMGQKAFKPPAGDD